MKRTVSSRYVADMKICGKMQRVVFFRNAIRRKEHILEHLLNEMEAWNDLIGLNVSGTKRKLQHIGCDLKECRAGCNGYPQCDGIVKEAMEEYMKTVFACIRETDEYRPLHTHNRERLTTGKWVDSMYFACTQGLFVVISPLYTVRTAYRPGNSCVTIHEFYEEAVAKIWRKKGNSVEKWCPSKKDWRKEYFRTMDGR